MGKSLTGKDLGKGITQRGDGTYMGRFVNRYGKRETYYNRDLREVKRRLESARYESENGIMGSGEAITLDSWFESFLELYKVGKVKDTTVYRIRQTYSSCKNNIIGSLKLKDIRAIHVQQLRNELAEKGHSHGSLKLIKSLLNEMSRMAIGNGYMTINPVDAVVLPKAPKKEARYLTEEEQALFLSVSVDYSHHEIFCFALASGLRIGEVLGIKWKNINFQKLTISIEQTLHYGKVNEEEQCHFFFTSPKTESSQRVIPLLPEMEKVLLRVKRKQVLSKASAGAKWNQQEPFEDMVFTSQYGAPVRWSDVNRTIKQVIAKANLLEEEIAKYEDREPIVLEPFSPHCFRHTFITRCKASGIPYSEIMPFVGHTNERTTGKYDHYKPEMEIEKLKQVSFLGGMV